MPDGGKLTLETGSVYLDEKYASATRDVSAGQYVLIAVSDTGTGIPAALIDKVFDPFFTTKEVGKGTGLGLSMVYGFVKQSGGHIKIYSEEGHGTTVKIYLPPGTGAPPVSEPAVVPVVRRRPPNGSLWSRTTGWCGIMSSPNCRPWGMSHWLREMPPKRSPLSMQIPTFDLLFTDVIMPGGINGRQLADEIRKRQPDLRVLFTSGYTENAIIHHGRLDSGVSLLAKPYRKSDLARMIRMALGA